MSGLGDVMSDELRLKNATAARDRYTEHLEEYQAIFGEDTVWCRPIPHIKPGHGHGP